MFYDVITYQTALRISNTLRIQCSFYFNDLIESIFFTENSGPRALQTRALSLQSWPIPLAFSFSHRTHAFPGIVYDHIHLISDSKVAWISGMQHNSWLIYDAGC
jgi:hypothetical protein